MNRTTITAVGDMASSFVTMAYLLNRKGYKYGKTEDLDSFQSILGDLVRNIYLERASPTTTPFAEERGSPRRTSPPPVLSSPGSPKFKSSPVAAENKSGSLCKTQATVSPNVTQNISRSPCGTTVAPSPNVTQNKSESPGRTPQNIPVSPCRTPVAPSPNVTYTKSGSPGRTQSPNTSGSLGRPRVTPLPDVSQNKSESPGRRQSPNICGSPGRAIVPPLPDVSQNKSESPGRTQSPNISGSAGRAIVPPSPDVTQNKSGSPGRRQSPNICGSPGRAIVPTSPDVTQNKSGSPGRRQSPNISGSPGRAIVPPSPDVTQNKSGSACTTQATKSPKVTQQKLMPCRTVGSTSPVVTQQKSNPVCASKLPRKAPSLKAPWIPSCNFQTFNRAGSNPALKLPQIVGKSQSKLAVPSNLRLNENACPGTSGAKSKPPIQANLKTCPAPQPKKYTGAIPKIAISRPVSNTATTKSNVPTCLPSLQPKQTGAIPKTKQCPTNAVSSAQVHQQKQTGTTCKLPTLTTKSSTPTAQTNAQRLASRPAPTAAAPRPAQLGKFNRLETLSKPRNPLLKLSSEEVREQYEIRAEKMAKAERLAAKLAEVQLIADKRAREIQLAQRKAQGKGDQCTGTRSTAQTNVRRPSQVERAKRLENLSKPRRPLPSVRLSQRDAQGQGDRCTGTGSTTQTNAQTRGTASNQQRQISRPNLNRAKSPNSPKKKC